MGEEVEKDLSKDQKQPLDLLAQKAMKVVAVGIACVVCFALLASYSENELAKAKSTVSVYAASDNYYYEYGSSDYSAYYEALRSEQTHEALAPLCLFMAYASAGVVGASSLAWVGANLLIAYKKSEY